MIDRGHLIEAQAAKFLKAQGLKIYMRNFRCKLGELDIIAFDARALVFVEVRYRASTLFGGALTSITYNKQQKMLRTAQVFLQKKRSFQQLPCRFDVIAIDGPMHDLKLEWIKNVIYL